MATVTTTLVDVQELADRLQTPDGGFTIDTHTGQDVTAGFAVSIFPERSRELPAADAADIATYVASNADLLVDPDNRLGGWHDPATGHIWLDVSLVLADRDEAIKWAEAANQIAIFDLATFESIPTGGTGRPA